MLEPLNNNEWIQAWMTRCEDLMREEGSFQRRVPPLRVPGLLAFYHCLDLYETRDVLLGMLPEDMILTAFSFLLGVGNSQGLPSLGLGKLGEWAQEVSFDVSCRSLPPASPFPSLSVYLHLQ